MEIPEMGNRGNTMNGKYKINSNIRNTKLIMGHIQKKDSTGNT